jgi:FAD/FMN-containing dehydrogenase
LGERRTLGGIVALNACGPERLRYGAPRDLLLGLKFISGTGRQISAGGRVMKNVAGYDVTRLLAGSAGTLGFLTELTFRIQSVPPCCSAVRGGGSLEQVGSAAAWLLQSKLEPNFIVAMPDQTEDRQAGAPFCDADSGRGVTGLPCPGATGPSRDGREAWQLVAGFEGFRETVDAQVAGFRAGLAEHGLNAPSSWEYPAQEGICRAGFASLYGAPFVLRVDLPPNRIVALLSSRQDLIRDASLLVDWGCGRLTAALADLGAGAWTQWHAAAEAFEGTVMLERAPDAFRQEHDVFGPPRPDWELTHKIKMALDPHGILSPGRLPGRR